MNDSPPPYVSDTAGLHKQIADLTRGMKIGFSTLLLIVSYLNIRIAFCVPGFRYIFTNIMVPGQQLPMSTGIVIDFHLELLALSMALPVISVAALCMKSPVRSLTIFNVMLFAAALQFIFTAQALHAPLIGIISTMSSGTP